MRFVTYLDWKGTDALALYLEQ